RTGFRKGDGMEHKSQPKVWGITSGVMGLEEEALGSERLVGMTVDTTLPPLKFSLSAYLCYAHQLISYQQGLGISESSLVSLLAIPGHFITGSTVDSFSHQEHQ
ncbi:hypothetical protein P7K49_031709, partial [Saguinus oedipus]